MLALLNANAKDVSFDFILTTFGRGSNEKSHWWALLPRLQCGFRQTLFGSRHAFLAVKVIYQSDPKINTWPKPNASVAPYLSYFACSCWPTSRIMPILQTECDGVKVSITSHFSAQDTVESISNGLKFGTTCAQFVFRFHFRFRCRFLFGTQTIHNLPRCIL